MLIGQLNVGAVKHKILSLCKESDTVNPRMQFL